MCAVIASIACSSNDSTTNAVNQSTLDWQACESVDVLECTEFQVPMDYSQPDGEQITLSLIRKPSSGDNKLGALLFNPGGPGGSGVELIEAFHEFEAIPDSILAAYDIVSFDPRGVGQSTPVSCVEFGLNDIDEYPKDAAAINTIYDQYASFASACSGKYGSYLQHLGSLNVVRDMDEIREAMGEDKLNFIGYSYGTRLAALYLQEFPTSSGRIVLDGSVHPDSSLNQMIRDSLPAYQSNIRSAVAQCTTIESNCDVNELMSILETRINNLLDDQSVEAQLEFSMLFELLNLIAEDPAIGMIAASTIYHYITTLDVSVLIEASIQFELLGITDGEEGVDDETMTSAVMCADDDFRPTKDSLVGLLAPYNDLSDIAAEGWIAQSAMCVNWPPALEPLPLIATSTAPSSLVIGGTTDAQTPLAWSEAMAQAIGGVYIRSEHLGHGVVFDNTSACIDSMVEQFLLDGLAPAQTQCNSED